MRTPNLDQLAEKGIRFTQFYNTARCCPTRASILTGLHPHQTGIGWMATDLDEDGYRGDLNDTCVTIAEALKLAGYATYMSGKWHISRNQSHSGSKHSWPCQRGFDRYFGILGGAASYWQPSSLTRDNEPIDLASLPEDFFLTDAISDEASNFIREHATVASGDPFFSTQLSAHRIGRCTHLRKILSSTRADSQRGGTDCVRNALNGCVSWVSLRSPGH